MKELYKKLSLYVHWLLQLTQLHRPILLLLHDILQYEWKPAVSHILFFWWHSKAQAS